MPKRNFTNNTALLIVTMVDTYWSKSAELRVNILAPIINNILKLGRKKGYLIIFGVGRKDVLDSYINQRKKLSFIPNKKMIEKDISFNKNPLLPNDYFCYDNILRTIIRRLIRFYYIIPKAKKIHPLLIIKKDDIIIDTDKQEVYNVLNYYNISNVILMGVHSNDCIINKPYGLKQLKKWGFKTLLVRDLTDSFYSSFKYNHLEANEKAIEYIEKYFSSTITSVELIEKIINKK